MRSFFAYGFVSMICVVLHNLIVIGGDILGFPYFGSILVSFSFVTTVGYVLQSLFTFDEALGARRFMRYLLAMSTNIPLVLIAIWIWHDVVGLAMFWASPIATICMIAVNFVLSRWAIRPQATRMI
ncbi:GtrA family protein [Sphingopyxis sp.]|uniref:GtrA family protein n=1 Tax=Sphingopyxis sp. TaxID=1908224 RepID=UPI0025D5D75B|nr:GtrA family protein [Sphingopyxis sp.]MBK6413504.1 GtrA family protein [Sphingopyxis sp.]